MRLWSLHPCYLDAKGLTALWREGLLAKKVLQGRTRGYRNHPQLERFRAARNPVGAIDCYLRSVYQEAAARGYRFDAAKIDTRVRCAALRVTTGQLRYELEHLKGKLLVRDARRYAAVRRLRSPLPHPLFVSRPGTVEPWERVG